MGSGGWVEVALRSTSGVKLGVADTIVYVSPPVRSRSVRTNVDVSAFQRSPVVGLARSGSAAAGTSGPRRPVTRITWRFSVDPGAGSVSVPSASSSERSGRPHVVPSNWGGPLPRQYEGAVAETVNSSVFARLTRR